MEPTTAPTEVVVGGPHRRSTGLHFSYLDGVRAAAAAYVVLHHIWLAVWTDYPENAGPWWTGWLPFGHLSVAVFIVVSGFSLALGPATNGMRLPGGPRQFYRRRAWRILPAYWAALAFAVVVVLWTGVEASLAQAAKATVVHALLLQDIVGSDKPNGAFWSIAIEVQIYLLFPLILIWRRRFGAVATVVAGTFVAIVAYELSINGGDQLARIGQLVPQFFALFVMGMGAAEIAMRLRSTGARAPFCRIAAIGTAGMVAWAAVVGSKTVIHHLFWVELAAGALMALTLAGLADGVQRPLRRGLDSRPARSLGAISYSTYLIHAPILLMVWLWLVEPHVSGELAQFFVLGGVSIPLILGCAYAFSRLIEQPTQRHRSIAELRAAIGGQRRRRMTEPSDNEVALAD